MMNRTKTRWIAAALSAVCCLSASRTNFAGDSDSANATGLSWVVWHPGERRNVVDGSPQEPAYPVSGSSYFFPVFLIHRTQHHYGLFGRVRQLVVGTTIAEERAL